MASLPPARGLRVLEALWRTGSINGAANSLNITYSAISHQLKGLETYSDVPLVIRKGRRTVLTEAGVTLAQAVHKSVLALQHEIDMLGMRARAPITIAAVEVAINGWLLGALAEYFRTTSSHPVHVTSWQNDVALTHEPDIAIGFSRDGRVPPDATVLMNGQAIAVASTDFLCSNRITCDRDILLARRAHDEDSRMWQQFFDKVGLDPADGPRPELFVSGSSLARDVALGGHAIALCRLAFIRDELKAGRLVQLSPVMIDEQSCYFMVKSPRSRPVVDALHEFLKSTI